MARLGVWLHGRFAGWLQQKDNGNLQFRYDSAYVAVDAPPVGHAMPLTTEAYPHRTCLAVFGGVLPEQDVRRAVAQLLGVSERNDYRLLEQLGGDCAGALEFHPEAGRAPRSSDRRIVTPNELARILRELPRRPLGVEESGAAPRMSLAGAQGKLPVVIDQRRGEVSIPAQGGEPTTHILKPQPDRFPGLVDNEHFCMSLAAQLALRAAPTRAAVTTDELPYLVIERFDRDQTRDPVVRLHQEDLCQALGVLPDHKYQAEGGPSVVDVVDLLRRAASIPAQDVPRLWGALVLNVLVGNCDAHGKNYSLLYDGAHPTLAPLYDIVSTVAYPELTTRLSMSIAGARDITKVDLAAWEQCALAAGVNPRYALDEVRRIARLARDRSARMVETAEHDNDPARCIAARIERVAGEWGA